MGISSGWPQPITTMEVGVGRDEREDGGMEVERVRMYSWQFCCWEGIVLVVFFLVSVACFHSLFFVFFLFNLTALQIEGGQAEGGLEGAGETYAAEKMPDEYHQHLPLPILVIGIQALECVWLVIRI